MLTGVQLGRYKLGRMIGAGGMGEVYIARDEELGRDVALKVLLPEFCSQEERVKRFKFEAKAVSGLNHPSIITIHEIAEIDEKLFIATEYIDGKTLRERIEAKDLKVFDAVKIAEQVADALTITHEANIIHRDIKPENIIIRNDGYAKVLDFGLAKPIIENRGELSTEDLVKTQPGLVMGSVRYMSPEQARGVETDERTDIWSLGVVLYEMLTGENPFDGETVSDSLAAVIHKEPKKLKDIPNELGGIIDKCLNKKPIDRYQNIKDLSIDLRDIAFGFERSSYENSRDNFAHTQTLEKQDTSENKTLIHRTVSADSSIGEDLLKSNDSDEKVAAQQNGTSGRLIATLAFVGMLIVAGIYILPKLFSTSGATFHSVNVSRFTDTGNASRAVVSPDGKMVAFVENREKQSKLMLRQIETGGTVEILPFTNRDFNMPAFSPDGNFIYYALITEGVGTLYKIPTLGGKSTELITDIDSHISFSPDGERFAFFRHNAREGGSEIIIADKDGKNSSTLINTKDVKYERFDDVSWSADGKKILAMGFEQSELEFRHLSVITADVESKKIEKPSWMKEFNEQNWWAGNNFVWLKDESGIIFIGKREQNEARQIYNINFSDGKIKRITNDISNYGSVSISDDAKVLVANKVDVLTKLVSYTPKTNETKDILPEDKKYSFWSGFTQTKSGDLIYTKYIDDEMLILRRDSDGKEKTLLSTMKYNMNPKITQDEKYIVYRASKKGQSNIWRSDIDGANQKELTKKQIGEVSSVETSPDAKYVYFTRQSKDGGKLDVFRVSIDGGEVRNVFPEIKEGVKNLLFSPNGELVAYHLQSYDFDAQKFDSKIVISKYDDNKIGEKVKEFDISVESNYQWSLDSKSITFIKEDGSDNLWNFNIETEKQTQLTNLKSEFIASFIWAKKDERLLIFEGKVNNDLILLKNNTEK